MDGWNVNRLLTRLALVAAATLLPAAGLHAEALTSCVPAVQAPAGFAAPTMPHQARIAVQDWLQSAGRQLGRLQQELATELVATQLPLIGGHIEPKKNKSAPGNPAPQGGNPPPPPPPPGPGDNGGPGGGLPPGGLGDPPPAAPEPASVVTALLGVGLTTAAWRYRRRPR